ncbi:MAG: hypothetical protein LBH00_11380 [Planctomycetaceae bacterium]|jgi:hypothetical protein|nr:hypothetical protein [Planctomycetaceae bacterium]
MAASKKKEPAKKPEKKAGSGNSGEQIKQFFIYHGEKIAFAVFTAAALWLSVQGFGFQSLKWRANELEETAADAENGIRRSSRSAADENVKVFDYAQYAEQISKTIPLEPYQFTGSK